MRGRRYKITCLVDLLYFCVRIWAYCTAIDEIGSKSRLKGRQTGQGGGGLRVETCGGLLGAQGWIKNHIPIVA